MARAIRYFLLLVALSVLFAPIHILLVWPRLPTSGAGWVVLLFLPFPLAAAGDWLLQYRDVPVLRPIDALAMRIAASPYRLAVSVLAVVLACFAAFGLLALLP